MAPGKTASVYYSLGFETITTSVYNETDVLIVTVSSAARQPCARAVGDKLFITPQSFILCTYSIHIVRQSIGRRKPLSGNYVNALVRQARVRGRGILCVYHSPGCFHLWCILKEACSDYEINEIGMFMCMRDELELNG